MKYNEIIGQSEVSFSEMPPGQFLLGFLSSFDNRFQACFDNFFPEITWKQFFAVICVKVCGKDPTINELSEVMGSSHQNVKQILLKLENKGFVEMYADSTDRRKQRIRLTDKCEGFCKENDKESAVLTAKMSEGISNEDFATTIKVISMLDGNIKRMQKEMKK